MELRWDSDEVCGLGAESLERRYKGWLCCLQGCVGMGYDSVAASEEEVGSSCWGEEYGVP